MPARWRILERMVDHGALMMRENLKSTTTESEGDLDTDELFHVPTIEPQVPYPRILRFLAHKSASLKLDNLQR